MLRILITFLLACNFLAFTACTQALRGKTNTPPTAAQPGLQAPGDSILKLAQVDVVRADVSPTQPPEAVVVINGLLHDGATRVHEVQQQRLADGFVLTVVTIRPKSAVASLALIPFERTVSLNLQGMPKGPCRIVANGVGTTVMVP